MECMDVSENSGTPQIIHFNRVFHCKPSIFGYHYFWKHPYLRGSLHLLGPKKAGGCSLGPKYGGFFLELWGPRVARVLNFFSSGTLL